MAAQLSQARYHAEYFHPVGVVGNRQRMSDSLHIGCVQRFLFAFQKYGKLAFHFGRQFFKHVGFKAAQDKRHNEFFELVGSVLVAGNYSFLVFGAELRIRT